MSFRGEHTDYDAVVVGAGLGGLTAAGRLAHGGMRTAVFEQAPRAGGCCGSVEYGDYQFDVGATVVLFLEQIEEYFRSIDRRMSDYVDFLTIEPIFDVVSPDGNRFKVPTSSEEMARIFGDFSAEDGEGWKRFSQAAESGMSAAMSRMFTKRMQELGDLKSMAPALNSKASSGRGGGGGGGGGGGSGAMFESFESTLRSFFSSEEALAALSLSSYSVGLPPALAPGFAAFLSHAEHRGSYYPRGGMKAIPMGMARALEEEGGEIHLNSRVTKILSEGKRVLGIELADGREIRSKVVITDINVKAVYSELLPPSDLPYWARLALRSLPLSQSSVLLMLAVEGSEGFGAHHTLFSEGLEALNRIYFEDYERGRPSRGGYLLASTPSLTDPSLAPPGHHTVHLHTLAPYRLARGGDWEKIREEQKDRMLDYLEVDYGLRLRERIRDWQLVTPVDLERDVGLYRGALYGLESGLLTTSLFRPRMRSSQLERLYLVGSSVHLGGGIPVCIGSGMIGADMVLEDLQG